MTTNNAPPRPAPIPLGQEPRPQRPAPGPSTEPRKAPASKTAKGNKPKRDRCKADRFAPLNAFVLGGGLARLKSFASVAVYLTLFQMTDRKTGAVRVSQETLARLTGISPRSVRSGISELEHLGAITIRFRGNEFSGVSAYRLTIPPVEGVAT